MEGRLGFISQICKWANVIAGVTLTLMMLVTVADVILRPMGKAIVGIFELVAFAGAVVIGFSVPFTSWVRGHIYVDFFVQRFSNPARKIVNTTTRCLGIGLFLMIGWNLFLMGTDLFKSGEVSLTLQMPFYPVVYGIGVCCFIQVLVLVADIVKIFRGQYE
jgi:TRAP-type C4-dicarboxylate transport system permease small subunit